MKKKLAILLIANIVTSIGTGVSSFTSPWLLIKMPMGEKIFGYLSIAIMIAFFFLYPYFGKIIDSYSRKMILVLCELISAVFFSLVTIMHFMYKIDFNIVSIVLITIVLSLYNAIQIPTLTAFTQEIFPKSKYNKVNSLIEVQGQAAFMISAGLAALFVGKIDIGLIFIFDIITYIFAFLLLLFMPYQKRENKQPSESISKNNSNSDIKETLAYVKHNSAMFILIGCSLVPSIMVLVCNYVDPVFLYKDLKQLPSTEGISSLIYSGGAVLGGIIASFLSKKMGNTKAILATYSIYTISILGIVLFPYVIPFLMVKSLSGIGNAGTRVLRKNIMLAKVPNRMIGKVEGLLQSFSLLVQIILISIFSQVIGVTGSRVSFIIMLLTLLFFFIGVLYSNLGLFKRNTNMNTTERSV